MEKVRAQAVIVEDKYSPEIEGAHRNIICQDYILSEDEARVFNELSRIEYEDAVEYEQKHKK